MHVIKYTYTHRSISYALFIKSLSRSPKQPEANGCSNMSRQRSFYTASGCLWKHPELFLIGTGFPGGSSNYATIPQFLGYSFIRKRQNSCTTGRTIPSIPSPSLFNIELRKCSKWIQIESPKSCITRPKNSKRTTTSTWGSRGLRYIGKPHQTAYS